MRYSFLPCENQRKIHIPSKIQIPECLYRRSKIGIRKSCRWKIVNIDLRLSRSHAKCLIYLMGGLADRDFIAGAFEKKMNLFVSNSKTITMIWMLFCGRNKLLYTAYTFRIFITDQMLESFIHHL